LDIRRIETLKDGTEAVGNRVRVKVVKNKVAPPFRQAEFDIEFGKGISTSGCLIDLGIEHDIVSKSGSFFTYGGERLGQGRGNAKAFLDENPAVAKEIEQKIYAALGIDDMLAAPIQPAPAAKSPPQDAGPTQSSIGAADADDEEPDPARPSRVPAGSSEPVTVAIAA
jgi:recombination protein RecA